MVLIRIKLSHILVNIATDRVRNKRLILPAVADTKAELHQYRYSSHERLLAGENEQWLCRQKIVEKSFSEGGLPRCSLHTLLYSEMNYVATLLTYKFSFMFQSKFPHQGNRGGEKRQGLGPRNDVLTTGCKAVILRGGQRIIAIQWNLY